MRKRVSSSQASPSLPHAKGGAEWIAFAVAGMFHLGLLALGTFAPAQNDFFAGMRVESDVPSELLIEITRADDAVTPRSEDDRAGARVTEPLAVNGRVVNPVPETPSTPDVAPTVVDRAPVDAERDELPPPAPSVDSPDDSSESFDSSESYGSSAAAPGISVAGLGFGGTNVWALDGVLPSMGQPDAAPTTAPRRKAVDGEIATRVLNETLSQRDRELGLDQPAGGIVAGAIADAVRSAPTPDDTKATFEVTVAPGGKVTGSRVVNSTKGTTAMWERAAKGAAAALATQSLAMRGDARTNGATVTVTVEAKNVYPAGSKKTIDVRPVCANQVINDILAADQANAEGRPSPPPGQADDSDFCIPIAVAGVGDVSNFGANVQKVVRTTHAVKINGHRDLPAEIHPVNRDAPWLKHREKKGPVPTLPPEWRRKKKEREKKKRR